MDSPTAWLCRLILNADPQATPVYVRAISEGTAPTPESPAEVIADPFADRFGDAWQQIGAAKATVHELGELLRTHTFAPPCVPRKVIGVGRNYRAHAQELGHEVPSSPLLFFKPSSSLIGSGQALTLPRDLGRIDMEAEVVAVIGKRAKNLAPQQALEVVLGYTVGNDISARELQKKEPQWARAKGLDGFGPLGPWIRLCPPGFVLPVQTMNICGKWDGKVVQRGRLADMIFDMATLISTISHAFTLEPGDVIYTGTPEGVTALEPNRICEVYTEGFDLGHLTNVMI